MEKFDLSIVEQLNKIFTKSDYFHRKNYIKITNRKKVSYQYHNWLCASILRIRETVKYIDEFKFIKSNTFGHAFDFYEYINCISIILECVETLFELFQLKFSKIYTSKVFKKSNTKKNVDDISFFKFVRSAAFAHPLKTNRYREITKGLNESFPYIIWNAKGSFSSILINEKDSDLSLVGWKSKSKSRNSYYFLYLDEFYTFVAEILVSLKALLPIVDKQVGEHLENQRFKNIKKRTNFSDINTYIDYLQNRLLKYKNGDEDNDGGLLLGKHIINNKIIGSDFKKYIESRIGDLAEQTMIDINGIGYNYIFENLRLINIIKNISCNAQYINEKFFYIYLKAIDEIKTNKFDFFKLDKCMNDTGQTDEEWGVCQLMNIGEFIFQNQELTIAKTYTDLYEITLECIFEALEKESIL